MRIVEGLSVGISAIRSNKMRSLLTMLGIIIGVAAVLAMIAIGDGAKEIVKQDVQKLGGANQVIMYRTWYKRVNNRWVRNRSSEYLKYGDVLAIAAECPSIKAVTPQEWNWGGVLIQAPGGTETRAGWNGVDTTYKTAMDWDLKEGVLSQMEMWRTQRKSVYWEMRLRPHCSVTHRRSDKKSRLPAAAATTISGAARIVDALRNGLSSSER